ncbi:hypothetical protein B0H14DRAFT_2598609 [Mycena olivaceomarginata]|nr:hypothetical protein B0H14DRAFT_2598609 [Mycena olivaceomarginata]
MSRLNIPPDDFLNCMVRSSPPLHSLCLVPDNPWSAAEVENLCGLAGGLMEVAVTTSNAFPFLNVLKKSQDLLPNLRSLNLCLRDGNRGHYYEGLLRIASARQTRLNSVRFIVQEWAGVPKSEILASFRRLAADGREIYIGKKDTNYLCSHLQHPESRFTSTLDQSIDQGHNTDSERQWLVLNLDRSSRSDTESDSGTEPDEWEGTKNDEPGVRLVAEVVTFPDKFCRTIQSLFSYAKRIVIMKVPLQA